jgi:ABC-type transport system involved in multi-copper enzyme maturation permease subunit
MVSWLKDWQVLSVLHYFSPKDILHDGLNWWHIAVLLSLTAMLYIVANVGFRRRDVS